MFFFNIPSLMISFLTTLHRKYFCEWYYFLSFLLTKPNRPNTDPCSPVVFLQTVEPLLFTAICAPWNLEEKLEHKKTRLYLYQFGFHASH